MDFLIGVLALALIAVVILLVSAPLRGVRGRVASEPARRGELEAAREAKYREIRDAELDFRTGKLSREDYEAINATLRTEALEILNRLESPGPGTPAAPPG